MKPALSRPFLHHLLDLFETPKSLISKIHRCESDNLLEHVISVRNCPARERQLFILFKSMVKAFAPVCQIASSMPVGEY